MRRRAVFPMHLLPLAKAWIWSTPGSSSSVARSPSSSAVCRFGDRSELNDHGDAARPSQQCDVTCWTTAQERHAAAVRPVDFQKPRRRQIVSADYRAIRDLGDFGHPAAQDLQHPIAQVRQVGRTRAQILIGRGIVIGDLLIERRGPGNICRDSGVNRRIDRIEKVFVFQKGNLKFEYLRRLIARGICEERDLPARAVQGGANCKILILPRAADTFAVRCRLDSHERPAREADRGGLTLYPSPVLGVCIFTGCFPESRWRRD